MSTEKKPTEKKRRLPLGLTMKKPAAVEKDPQPRFKPIMRGRITINDMVYHQVPHEQPKLVQTKFTRVLNTGEQVYVRDTEATTRWVHVDIGWVKEIGQIIIRNREDRILYTVPTKEQLAALDKLTLEIGVKPEKADEPIPFAMIRPGESCRFEPVNDQTLWIRSREEKVKVQINAIPE
jgi:hypothetical protein